MGKYEALETDVFSVFSQQSWKNENIKTFPVNFVTVNPGNEFIRVSVLPSGDGINIKSVSGLFVVDIFTPAGNGPRRTSLIADKLDQYLVGKVLTTSLNGSTQFLNSTLRSVGLDRDNPSLYRSIYQIPFNYFGV
jgi:hypothetical protein